MSHAPNRIHERGKHSHGHNKDEFFGDYLSKTNAENGEHLDKMKHFIRIIISFREALHERSPEMVNIYDDIQSW